MLTRLKRLLSNLKTWLNETLPPDDIAALEVGQRSMLGEHWSLGVGAVVAAYFAADYLAFIPPATRAIYGLVIGVGIVMIHRGASTRTRWKTISWQIVPVMALCFVSWSSYGYLTNLNKEAMMADKRCAAIQHAMLSAQPSRDDLPDIFEALRCHASGQDPIAL